MKSYFVFLPAIIVAILLSSCQMFNKIGENAGDGFGRGITPHVDAMGEIAVGSVRRGIDQAEFDMLIDSLVSRLSDSLGAGVFEVRELLLGDATAQRVAGLRDTLIGDETRRRVNAMVAAVMEDLLGDRTRNELRGIRDELMGDALRLQLADLRDELMGETTEQRLAALARSFVLEVGRSYADTLRPQIREDIEYTAEQSKGVLSWLRENIISVIVVLGLVVAGLIGFAWYLRRKRIEAQRKNDEHLRMVEIMTGEIDELRKNYPEVYDRMKNHIQTQAVKEKVEKPLREILDQQGILRSE